MSGEIFISYRRADEPQARLLYNRLKELGVEAWYDAHVGAGEDWRTATAKALQNARIFVLLFSRAAAASDDITKELAAATFSKKLVVPVRIEDIQPEGAFLYELAGRNWINAFDETEAKLGELARSLAALVKSGKEDPAMLPFDRGTGETKATPKKRGRVGLFAAGGALVLAVVAGVGAYLTLPKARAVNQRFAFFGFDSAPDLEQAAAVATDTMFKTLTSERMDTAPQGETVGTTANERLSKAAALGAQYALTGEIHRIEGGKLTASVQLVDVPSKTTLWPTVVEAPADNPSLLAERAAYRAVQVAKCTGGFRSTLAKDDLATVRLMPGACENVTLRTQGNPAVWRELAARAPESAPIQISLISMINASRVVPGADSPKLFEEAKAALARVEVAAPESADAYRGRATIAMWNSPNLAEGESILLEGLARWPDDSWMNYFYAAFLREVGRVKDSVVPMQISAGTDPLSPLKQTYLAKTMAASGALPVEGRKILDRLLSVSQFNIAWHALYGTLPLDSEESIDAIIAAAPESIFADQVNCARIAATAARILRNTPGKKKNSKLGCDPGAAFRADVAFGLYSYAGDLDAAFAVDIPRLPLGELVFLFLPSTREARLDERFESLATRLGLLEYWRTTGKLPDFCATEDASVCATLKAGVPK